MSRYRDADGGVGSSVGSVAQRIGARAEALAGDGSTLRSQLVRGFRVAVQNDSAADGPATL
jgi:hypothetical protein